MLQLKLRKYVGRRGTYDERVTLGSEDLDRVDGDWLRLDTIGLDDGEVVVVDAEDVVRVARQRDEPEAVAIQPLSAFAN